MRREHAYTPSTVAAAPNDPACGAMPWHVIQSEPAAEFHALSAIAALPGIRGYLPIEVRTRMKLRHGRPVIENGRRAMEQAIHPFFRGYLFAAFDPALPLWGAILRARGVKRLFVTATGRPIPLRPGVVEALQARGRAGDGAIDLAAPVPSLVPGTRVRIADPDSPLFDVEAVVALSSGQRVELMLGMLRLTAERAHLEPV